MEEEHACWWPISTARPLAVEPVSPFSHCSPLPPVWPFQPSSSPFVPTTLAASGNGGRFTNVEGSERVKTDAGDGDVWGEEQTHLQVAHIQGSAVGRRSSAVAVGWERFMSVECSERGKNVDGKGNGGGEDHACWWLDSKAPP